MVRQRKDDFNIYNQVTFRSAQRIVASHNNFTSPASDSPESESVRTIYTGSHALKTNSRGLMIWHELQSPRARTGNQTTFLPKTTPHQKTRPCTVAKILVSLLFKRASQEADIVSIMPIVQGSHEPRISYQEEFDWSPYQEVIWSADDDANSSDFMATIDSSTATLSRASSITKSTLESNKKYTSSATESEYHKSNSSPTIRPITEARADKSIEICISNLLAIFLSNNPNATDFDIILKENTYRSIAAEAKGDLVVAVNLLMDDEREFTSPLRTD